MTFKSLKKELLPVSKYRITNIKQVTNEVSTLFFYIYMDNKVLKAYHHEIDENEFTVVKNSNSIYEYFLNKEKKFFSKYNNIDISNMKILLYFIPKQKETKITYRNLIILENRVLHGDVNIFSNILKNIKKNYLIYSFIMTLYSIVYTSIIYVTLTEVGIPLNYTDNVQVIITIFLSLSILGTVSVLSGVVPYFLISMFTEFNFLKIEYIIIYIIVLISIFVISKSKIYYKFISMSDSFRILIMTLVEGYLKMCLYMFLLFLTLLPVLFVTDIVKMHSSWKDLGGKELYFQIYSNFYSYPKILIIKEKQDDEKSKLIDKKYILVGITSKHYEVYPLNEVLEYILLMDSLTEKLKDFDKGKIPINIVTEQFCRNIELERENNRFKVIYEVLSNSLKNHSYDSIFINIQNHKEAKIKPLNLKNIDLDESKLKESCKKLLSVIKEKEIGN